MLGPGLLEQLPATAPADAALERPARMLGLGLTFSFDLFIFLKLVSLVRAVGRRTAQCEAWSTRAGDAVAGHRPRRQADWFDRLNISRAAVFHSATLLLVGAIC